MSKTKLFSATIALILVAVAGYAVFEYQRQARERSGWLML